jgi:carboxypeptidase family protein/TonB-dependent receptor-like protein
MSRSIAGRLVGRAALCLPLMWIAGTAWAQAGGTLTGTVRDQSGAAVAGANLTLTNTATQGHWNTVATESGSYTIPALPPGTYDLTSAKAGFETSSQRGIVIQVATTITVDVSLQVGSATERIEVHAEVKQIERDTSEVGTEVSTKMVADLPLQVSGQLRSPIQFVELTPGFTGNLPNNPTSQLSFKLNGGQEGGTDVLVDGASISLTHPNLQMNYGVGTDAVAEFKVLTGGFPAQYGRATGGIVDLVTKSGTNEIHGTAYGFLRDKIFDSNSWLNNYGGKPRGTDSQKDLGAEVAGPIWIPKLYNGKNKTFFMFNTEEYRYKTGGAGYASVPDASWNQGDFSNLLVPTTSLGITYPAHQLYDWTTCTPGPCQPFAGNIIPKNRIDPVVAKAMAYFPAAQNSNVYNNFNTVSLNSTQANMFTAKLDEYISAHHKLSGSWSYDDRPLLSSSNLGAIFTTENPTQYTFYGRLNYAYIISPTLVNQFTGGFSSTHRAEVNMIPTLNQDLAAQIGLKGVTSAQLPSFLVTGGTGVTTDPDSADSIFVDNSYEGNDNLIWNRGRHSFKFGLDYRDLQFNTPQAAYSSGRFLFTPAQTSNLIDPNAGFGYASIYLGAANGAWIPTPQDVGMRLKYFGSYVQDDIKVSSRLTINLGLRWDVTTPVTEAWNRLSWMNPTLPNPGAVTSSGQQLPGAFQFAGSGAGRTGTETPQSIYWKALAPRVGVAYSLTPNTVIRSAYGIYYAPIIVNGFAQVESTGFSNSCRIAAASNTTTPIIQPGQMTGYPCALPPFINPAISNGALGGSPSTILANTVEPGRIQNWNIDIQHQFAKGFMLDVGYVGAHGDHLQAEQRAPNQLPTSALSTYGPCLKVLVTQQATDPACAGKPAVSIPYTNFLSDWGSAATVGQALRPFPQYTDLQLDNAEEGNPFGFYTYESLQVKVTKRFSYGLDMIAGYTWSKTLTNADGAYPPEGGWNNQNQVSVQDNYNATAAKALSAQDIPQWFVLSYSYELPFGKGKPLLNKGGVANYVVGGWKIAAIHTYESGYPISINCGGGYTSGIFNPACYVNVNSGVSRSYTNTSSNYGAIYAFNPAAFSQPASYTLGTNARITNIRVQNNLDEDVSLEKALAIYERLHAVLRLEAFDVLNRHRFTSIDNTVTDPGFGTWNGVGGNRSMQISLRLNF